MAIHIARRQFTVDDYHRMREAGILTEDDRVELIDGEVRRMSPVVPLHAAIVKRLNTLLMPHMGTLMLISVQDPIQLNDVHLQETFSDVVKTDKTGLSKTAHTRWMISAFANFLPGSTIFRLA